MKCIFCLNEFNEKDLTIEHIFPEAIGGTLKMKNVCLTHQRYLGTQIEPLLTNNAFVELIRSLLKIPGKDGHIPNPFMNGTMDGDMKVQYRMDKNGNPKDTYVVYNEKDIIDEKGLPGSEIRIDKKDAHKIENIIKKKEQRTGKKYLVTKKEDKTVPNKFLNIRLSVKLEDFEKPMLKIAYELACRWIGDNYLSDPNAIKIRKVILGEKTSDKFYNFIIKGQTPSPLKPWEDEKYSHFAIMQVIEDKIICYLTIFNNFEMAVELSADSKKYLPVEDKFICIEPKTRAQRESSLNYEIDHLIRKNNKKDGTV